MNILFLGALPPPYGGIASHLSDMKKDFESREERFMVLNVTAKRNPFRVMVWVFRLFWIITTKHVSLISAYHIVPEGRLAYWIKNILGIPYVLTVFGELHTTSQKSYKKILEGARTVVASSQYCASGVKNFADVEVRVVPYGIDLEHFRRKIPYVPNRCILFVGNIDKRFGLDILQEAINILGDRIPVAVVGEGDIIKNLSFLVERGVTYEYLPNWYNYSSILVNPANTKLPCMGLSMKEAMACELPVIATNAGGISEAVIHGETGLIFPAGDAHGLAKAINTLWENPALCKVMGVNGRKRAEELFDKNKTIETMREILR